MKDINIYKSASNGLGGNLDRTLDNNIFKLNVDNKKVACLYIKNDSKNPQKIIKLWPDSVDEIRIGLVTRLGFNEILKNTVQPVLENDLPEVDFTKSEHTFEDLVLLPNEFFSVWLYYIDIGISKIKRSHNVSINLQWVNV